MPHQAIDDTRKTPSLWGKPVGWGSSYLLTHSTSTYSDGN